MKILNIGFAKSAEDKKAWSGTSYKTYCGLKATGAEVTYLHCQTVSYSLFRYIEVVKRYFYKKVLKKQYLDSFSCARRDAFYRFLLQQDFTQYDYIFVTQSSLIASALRMALAKKNQNIPYIILADATFSALENYYPGAVNLAKSSSSQANAIGKHAFEGAYKVIFSSEWAKQHAINDYGIEPSKIVTIEFGANLDITELGNVNRTYSKDQHYNFLLSGVQWQRKGGDVAVECCRSLISKGYDVTLHIAGMPVPEKYSKDTFIVSHGFLNKNIPEQYQQFVQILLQSDVLLFPSRAECSAIALCEAAGLSLPVFCYDTGGLANYVVNGKNGYRLPLSYTGKDFAEKIAEIIDKGQLNALSNGAREKYLESLNWNTWSKRVGEEILK